MNTTTKFLLLATTGALAAGGGAVAAPADERDPRQRFSVTFRSVDGVDDPAVVKGRGPINGSGTVTQTENPRNTFQMVLDLPRGTVRMTAVERDAPVRFDPATCTATFDSDGTWRITGGTGQYAGARGSGEFTDHAELTGARDENGKCLGPGSGRPPAERVDTLEFDGTARR